MNGRKIMYLVFGTEMVNAVDEQPISEIDFLLTGGCFYKWDSSENEPEELIEATYGWDRYMIISEKEWNEYLKATGQVKGGDSQV